MNKITSFLEERDVPILTNLEPFFPKDKQETGKNSDQKVIMMMKMTLDRTAQDITKEIKKKMRILDRGSFSLQGQRH